MDGNEASLVVIQLIAREGVDALRDAIRYLRKIEDPEAHRLGIALITPRVLLGRLAGVPVDVPD